MQPADLAHLAIFGGSFNPPHLAHQLAVTWVLATQNVDEIWVMPTPSHAFGKNLAPFEHRVAMTGLAMRHFVSRVRISTLENELPKPARTLDTIKAILRRHERARISLVVGADILPETPQWKGWQQIEKLASIVVLGRGGYPGAGTITLPEISSTRVRELLAAGQDASHLLDREVLEYAVRHKLYV